jgi:hypothetical protein
MDYSNLKVNQLYELCRKHNIKGRSNKRKSELIELLRKSNIQELEIKSYCTKVFEDRFIPVEVME